MTPNARTASSPILVAGVAALSIGSAGRAIARSQRGFASTVYALLLEFPHFVMERKMLLGIKKRAERSAPTHS
jgi:hypothetical protein